MKSSDNPNIGLSLNPKSLDSSTNITDRTGNNSNSRTNVVILELTDKRGGIDKIEDILSRFVDAHGICKEFGHNHGPQNYQWHPKGVKRIGCIMITIVPNNEIRCLNIFYKYTDAFDSTDASSSLQVGSCLKKNSSVAQTKLDPFTFIQSDLS
jgi:hypothetical protein